MKPKTQGGFTLIELMIAVAVVAILATIALPSYRTHVLRSNRAVVRAALADLTAKQDVIRLQTRAFATTFVPLNGITGATPTFYIDSAAQVSATSGTGSIYKVVMTTASGNYSLTATPTGSQAKDTDCASISIDSSGFRSAANSAGTSNPDCWGR